MAGKFAPIYDPQAIERAKARVAKAAQAKRPATQILRDEPAPQPPAAAAQPTVIQQPAALPQESGGGQQKKKTTILRVKRKRTDDIADTIVLEAPQRSSKRVMIDSAAEALEPGAAETESSRVEDFNPAAGMYISTLSAAAASPAYSFDIPSANATQRKRFRYLTTTDQDVDIDLLQLEQQLKSTKTPRTAVTAQRSAGQLREAKEQSMLAASKDARQQALKKLRTAKSVKLPDQKLMMLDLVDVPQDPRTQQFTMPKVRSRREIEAEKAMVVHYYVYDADVDETEEKMETDDIIYVESFKERMFDTEYVHDKEYDSDNREFESDDSQNKDWQYTDEEESDKSSSSSSDDDDADMYGYPKSAWRGLFPGVSVGAAGQMGKLPAHDLEGEEEDTDDEGDESSKILQGLPAPDDKVAQMRQEAMLQYLKAQYKQRARLQKSDSDDGDDGSGSGEDPEYDDHI